MVQHFLVDLDYQKVIWTVLCDLEDCISPDDVKILFHLSKSLPAPVMFWLVDISLLDTCQVNSI